MTVKAYNQPLNLGLRFILEVFGFYALGAYGLFAFDSPWHVVAAACFPLTAALVWGIFRVPNDGGTPKVKVHGKTRLLIEFLFFSFSVAALLAREEVAIALVYGISILGHYVYSRERVKVLWLNGLLEAPFNPEA
ncbi:MAG: DUF2568 domain-containing protein [Bacteroidetes bacterium]|nr:MAG: DUF2568 domain-containing protein [Bacteroidota bacterium]